MQKQEYQSLEDYFEKAQKNLSKNPLKAIKYLSSGKNLIKNKIDMSSFYRMLAICHFFLENMKLSRSYINKSLKAYPESCQGNAFWIRLELEKKRRVDRDEIMKKFELIKKIAISPEELTALGTARYLIYYHFLISKGNKKGELNG